jgi:hypothetical protein
MVASLTPITKDRETHNKRTDTKNMPNLEWRKMSERRQNKKRLYRNEKRVRRRIV